MMKKALILLIAMTIVLTASGCSNYIRPPVAIDIATPEYETRRVAIAVDYFGVKHIARVECPIGSSIDCVLIYSKATSGKDQEIWSWYSATGYSGVYETDIAVTDSGIAVIAWNTTKNLSSDVTTLFMVSNDPFNVQELMPGYTTIKYEYMPLLVSRFNVIYAVDLVFDGAFYALRYRQMIGGSASGWVSEHGLNTTNTFPDAAVSPSGSLYVTYWRTSDSTIMYADNYGTSGDMTNRFEIIGNVPSYIGSVIDVYGSPETVYLAYYNHTGDSNDALFVDDCLAISCTGVSEMNFTYPLEMAKHWYIEAGLDIIADAGTNVYFVFRAKNDDSVGNFEIFEGYSISGVPQGVYNISNMSGYDDYPTIGLMAGYYAVTTWVHAGQDIYEFETLPLFYYAYQRKIHTTTHGYVAINYKRDMSCNADWGAGIWVEDETADRAYFIFNTFPSFLPMIKKVTGGSI